MAAIITIFEDYELDPERFELRRRGAVVPIEPQVFELLTYLVSHHDRVVLKDEIIGHVWPDGFISDSALNSRVMAARQAIGDNGQEQKLIRTIRGRGYRFVGRVERRDDSETAAGSPARPADDRSVDEPGRARVPGAPGLDVAATTFVGRQAELERLRELLAQPGCRLVTIVGPGGIGKTRLLAELARRLGEDGHEVAAVSLQPVETAHELQLAIAGALGLNLPRPEAATLADHIGDGDVVLFLDNFEQLVATGATTIATMVARTAKLRIVVTSREVLGLREEWLFPLEGLANAAGGGEPDALRLFRDREAQAGGVEQTSPEAEAAIRDICQLVDGMPLGLELAAALRRYLSAAEIATQVRRDIGVLRSDIRNLPARHRTISGLLEESCRHLSEEQLGILLSLSVFEGPFTLDAASEVAGAPLGAVGELVDRSLVQPRRGRFALHPLMRSYARERLGESFGDLQAAHAAFYAASVAGRRESLERGDQVAATAAIEAELPNVLAAWRWACNHGRLDLLALAGYPLYLFAHLRSRWAELRPEFERGIAAAERAGDEAWRTLADLLIFETWALMRTAPGPEVLSTRNRAEEVSAAHAAVPAPGFGTDPVTITAMILWSNGRYGRMQAAAEEAAERAHGRGDLLGEVYALWLGAVARNRLAEVRWERQPSGLAGTRPATPESEATLREARDLLDRVEALLAGTEQTLFRSNVLMERAINARLRGDRDDFTRLAQGAHQLRAEVGDTLGMANALTELIGGYAASGDFRNAETCIQQAEALVRKLGGPGERAELDRVVASYRLARGDHEDALRLSIGAADLSLPIGAIQNVLGSLRVTAEVLLASGDHERAAEINALVSGHPASPPAARAIARAALAEGAAVLGLQRVEELQERMRSVHLPEFMGTLRTRIPEAGTEPPGLSPMERPAGYQTPPKRLPDV